MKKAQLYIAFNGNTDEAFNFYRSVYGGEFMVRLNIPKELKCGSKPTLGNKLTYIVRIADHGVFFATVQSQEFGLKLTFLGSFRLE